MIREDYRLMDKISSHLTMKFMTVLMLWNCRRIFLEAYMPMVSTLLGILDLLFHSPYIVHVSMYLVQCLQVPASGVRMT